MFGTVPGVVFYGDFTFAFGYLFIMFWIHFCSNLFKLCTQLTVYFVLEHHINNLQMTNGFQLSCS